MSAMKVFTIVAIFAIFCCAKTQVCSEYNIGLNANDENDDIPDSAFSTNSMSAEGYRAARGRLNTIYEGTSNTKGGWMAEESEKHPWIEVNLQAEYSVKGIITQGRQCGNNWVTYYQVQYKGATGTTYYDVTNTDHLTMTFSGNSDRNTEVTKTFPDPCTAQYIRIRPTEWYGNAASLRFEIIACDD